MVQEVNVKTQSVLDLPLELSSTDFEHILVRLNKLEANIADILVRMEVDEADDIYFITKLRLEHTKVSELLQKSVMRKRKLEPNYGYQKLIDRE